MKPKEKEFYIWLKVNDASFKDAFTIVWWTLFNHKKADILMQCYDAGMYLHAAMKIARSGKFE